MTTLQPYGRNVVRAKLTGLHTATKRLANGSVCIYAYTQRGGPLLSKGVGRDLKSARDALERALGGKDTLARLAEIDGHKPKQSTQHIFGLVTAFLASPEFAKLAPSSQTAYRTYLERFRAEFGKWPIRHFARAEAVSDLVDWRDEMADTPRAADYALSAVGRLFGWARGRRLTTINPTTDIERLHRADRSDVIWTEGELVAFCEVANLEVQWAVRLAAYTGLRQGDLLRLPWSAVQLEANRIVLRTRKRNVLAIIPLLEPARALLETIPKRGPVVLTSRLEKPWTSDGFRSSFRRACLEAGIDKHFHDLRGTAVTRLRMADPSRSNTEIARIMGWSSERIDGLLALYVNENVVALDTLARMDQKRALTNQAQTGSDKSTDGTS
jgi:integrase